MKIRPCIDIHNGKVKQIVGGTLRGERAAENFVAQNGAAYYADLYRGMGLSGGHIIMLNRRTDGFYEADCREAVSALRAFPGGMQVGGGITPLTAPSMIEAGASHVIVTSYVFAGGRLKEEALREMETSVGRDRLVLDLSCRRCEDGKYRVVTDRWQKFTDLEICDETLDALCGRCAEFLIHAADVEGKRAGIERALVEILGRWQKSRGDGFPVTYAGGVHAMGDLDEIFDLSGGAVDVTVGSALDLFGGNLSLEEVAYHCECFTSEI